MPKKESSKRSRKVVTEATELERYKKALSIVYCALRWYARPDFYHACGFMFDPPCGGFDKDFSCDALVKEHGYNYPKPGKSARKAINKLVKDFGELVIESDELDDDIFPGLEDDDGVSKPH